MNPPMLNPETGRTIVYRGSGGEIVISSSYPEDTLANIVKLMESMLKKIVTKGSEISYVS